MNDLKSKWTELKSKVRMKWNKLTDADVSTVDGRCDQLTKSVQQRYGYSQDEAKRQVDQFCQENDIEIEGTVSSGGSGTKRVTDASQQAQSRTTGSQSAPGASRGSTSIGEGGNSGSSSTSASSPPRDGKQRERQGGVEE